MSTSVRKLLLWLSLICLAPGLLAAGWEVPISPG